MLQKNGNCAAGRVPSSHRKVCRFEMQPKQYWRTILPSGGVRLDVAASSTIIAASSRYSDNYIIIDETFLQ